MPPEPCRILFVCLGNICRSPAAEAVFRTMVADQNLDHRFEVDSVGTGGWHEGEPADPRSRAEGERRGHAVVSRARQIQPRDLEHFDFIICMDRSNQDGVTNLGAPPENVRLLLDWHPSAEHDEVPDPYYGGEDGFVNMYELIEEACKEFLEDLLRRDQAS